MPFYAYRMQADSSVDICSKEATFLISVATVRDPIPTYLLGIVCEEVC